MISHDVSPAPEIENTEIDLKTTAYASVERTGDVEMKNAESENLPAPETEQDKQDPPDVEANNEEEEDDDDDESEGYIVEDILNHRNEPGMKEWKYQIKWKGFDDPGDITWEPESHCVNAPEVIEQYWARQGGRQEFVFVEDVKRRKRKSEAITPKKRGRKSLGSSDEEWKVPLYLPSWENEIRCIDTLERDKDNQLLAYIAWPNGRRTKHNVQLIYDKCPRRMCIWYEDKLIFRSPTNGS